MASRAELIMAQVRGGLAQEYREKGPTKGQGIIQDLTGAALGYSTASEAIYAVEGGLTYPLFKLLIQKMYYPVLMTTN